VDPHPPRPPLHQHKAIRADGQEIMRQPTPIASPDGHPVEPPQRPSKA
jgi:hypothetical protein